MEDLLHLNLSFNLLIIWEKSVGFALLILMSEIPMFIKSVNLKFFDEHIFFLYLNQLNLLLPILHLIDLYHNNLLFLFDNENRIQNVVQMEIQELEFI